jgi:hypothetical protein
MFNRICPLLIFAFAVSCNSFRKIEKARVDTMASLRLLGEFDIPFNFPYQGTTVGGLSGIDYDPVNQVYNLISDDRSAINPARFYTAKIHFSEKGIDTVFFVSVKSLRQANGNEYPNSKQDPAHTPDPEALRLNPATRQFIWTSEGERIVKTGDSVLEDPAITAIDSLGHFLYEFPLPNNLHMRASESGPRQNGVFEGLSFDSDQRSLYISVEEPLYEDGPRADIVDNDPWIRLLKYDLRSRTNTAQFAYKLDNVARQAEPKDAFKINGIPDILWIAPEKLLVMERSFSTGNMACSIKIYQANLGNASNIIHNRGLKSDKHFIPVEKKLILNMDSLGIYTDNIEGITYGPNLPNGHHTLLFVSDNNFNVREKTQFLLFEAIP